MRLRGLAVTAALALALSGCGDDEPPPAPEVYAPLHYDYLPKLRLNVGSIDVQDHSAPVGPRDITASAPVQPAQALAQMAHDRLFAAALNTSTATFVIDQASLVREPNGTLDGDLAVHLNITTAAGVPAGYAAARIARQHVPGSDAENQLNTEYDLTKQMMADMNVELEFQLRRTLSSWLITGQTVPAPVEAQPLGPTAPLPPAGQIAPPGATPPAGEAGPMPPAAPDNGYQDPMAPPEPQQMSPPPGYLTPPPGVAPQTPNSY